MKSELRLGCVLFNKYRGENAQLEETRLLPRLSDQFGDDCGKGENLVMKIGIESFAPVCKAMTVSPMLNKSIYIRKSNEV